MVYEECFELIYDYIKKERNGDELPLPDSEEKKDEHVPADNALTSFKQVSSPEHNIFTKLSSIKGTKHLLLSGAEKITRTFSSAFESLSHTLKISTKKHQHLSEEPVTPGPVTPQSKVRALLGRTPIKLYSPFGIESPVRRVTDSDKEQDSPRKETSSWLSKKTTKKRNNVRRSLAKWNTVVDANRYSEMSPKNKKLFKVKYPIKLRD